ncbi:MAG: transglutaminase family protein [Candidatus Hermodarchaeota archaeon]|nr:transglutaminase family protein [Candidatus Hermodarchaeota archaeon]
MQRYRPWIIAAFLVFLVLVAMVPPSTIAFQYVHHWRVSFSGTMVIGGNQTLIITPYWDYIGNTSWQTCEQLNFEFKHNNETIQPTSLGMDNDGNPRVQLNITTQLQPQDSIRWQEEWLFSVLDHRPSLPQISVAEAGTIEEGEIQLGSDDYLWYTRATSLWKTRNISLMNIAASIRSELTNSTQDNVLALVYAAIQWIQSNILRSTGLTEPQYPEEVIVSQIGDCDDQSNLLITLLRIYGIPSYLATGHWFQEGARTNGFIWGSLAEDAYLYVDWKNSIGHGWAMVFVPPWGWLPFDLTTNGIGAHPSKTYYESLYASNLPFVQLWQIVASDYIAARRTEYANLFTYELHRTDFQEWTSLGSIPLVDFAYFATNVATLIALIGTLAFLSCLVGFAIRRQPREELDR